MEDLVPVIHAAPLRQAPADFEQDAATDFGIGRQGAARRLPVIGFGRGCFDQRFDPAPRQERQVLIEAFPGRATGSALTGRQRYRIMIDKIGDTPQQVGGIFTPARIVQIGFVDRAMTVGFKEGGEATAKRTVRRQGLPIVGT